MTFFSLRRRTTLFISALAVLLIAAAFSVSFASANSSFNLTVNHNINGRALGMMDRDLPVNVFLNGGLAIEDFRFGEEVSTSLPAGIYLITVELTDGTPLPSMTVGPVEIPAGVDVTAKARLDKNETPYLAVKAVGTEAAAYAGNDVDVKVRHNINGQRLDLPTALPVNVFINGGLAISDFRFGDVVSTSLPAGNYTITVQLLDGTPLPSMTVGPVDLAGGSDLVITARLNGDKVPFLNVASK